MRYQQYNRWWLVPACAVLTAAAQLASVSRTYATHTAEGPSDAAARKALGVAGKAAGLTVVPARVAGRPIPQVGEAVAMMLEQRGMNNLETSAATFTPADGADLAATARAFAEFVRANPPTTEWALFTDFQASKERTFIAVRSVIADRQGRVAWSDEFGPGDAAFDRAKPREPIVCCMLLADRLRPVLKLDAPKPNAPPGRITQRWQKSTGLPDKAGLDAIARRGETFKKSAATSRLLVYPVRIGDELHPANATNIANLLNEKKVTRATAAPAGPSPPTARDMNEQKVMWSMANGLREFIAKNPPDADYVLFAEYIMNGDKVGAVHFAVCDRQGELVIVEHQNTHTTEFKAAAPKSREDCDALVAKRIGRLGR